MAGQFPSGGGRADGQIRTGDPLFTNKAINSLKGALKDYINVEILGDKGFSSVNANLQFDRVEGVAVNPLIQAQVDKIYVETAVQPVNEIRSRLGLDPVEGGDEPVFVAGNQIMPLHHVEENSPIDLEQKKHPPAPPAALPPGKDEASDKTDEDGGEDDGGGSTTKATLAKALGKGGTAYDHQSIQLDLPEGLASKIKAFADQIPDADLNTAAGGREPDIHVTVLYGLATTVTPEQVARFVAQEEPIETILGTVRKFEGEDGDVLKIDVQSSGLGRLHQYLKAMVAAPGETFPVHQPSTSRTSRSPTSRKAAATSWSATPRSSASG